MKSFFSEAFGSTCIILACCLLILLNGACKKKVTEAETKPGVDEDIVIPVSDSTFALHNLGVNFEPWDPATNRAGDFLFKNGESRVFVEFGAQVQVKGGGAKAFPAFEYRVDRNANVTVVAGARIIQIDQRSGTQDYTILTRSIEDSQWDVRYDYIRNPRFAVGDTVFSGGILGNPGTWNADLGRVQIMVIHTATGLSHCPLCLFDSTTADVYKQKVLRHMTDWEAFKHDPAIYDEAAQVPPGCGNADLDDMEAEIEIPEPVPEPEPEHEFTLHNLGVDFEPWDPATNRAGDFLFRNGESRVFVEFGAIVETEGGGTREFPALEYRVDRNAAVRAVAEGRISGLIFMEDTQDYVIMLRSDVDPQVEVRYIHVKDPRVSEGDAVSPGTVLGAPGAWSKDLGRFRIMIIKMAKSCCPLCFLDPDSADVYKAKVSRLMADWESFKNDATIYDETDQALPGCRIQELNETEAPECYPDFSIHGLGVNFSPWDPSTNRAGDFLFKPDEWIIFLEFGFVVGTGSGTRELNTFEYKIDRNALVKAIAEGRITRFDYQSDTQDYEIEAKSVVNPFWAVCYDHVTNPRVALGDRVSSGTVLGNPETLYEDLGRFEISIGNNATGLAYCPLSIFDADSADAYREKVLRLMTDWEAFKNDTSIYDQENHVVPGCRYENMVDHY
jgi:hypothetical protein